MRKPAPGLLGVLIAAEMLGEMSWNLGLESVELERSLDRLEDIKRQSEELKRRLEEEKRRMNQMRLQLQTGNDTPWAKAYYAQSTVGVSALTMRREGLLELNRGAQASGQFPNTCLPQLRSAIIEMSQRIGRYPPIGGHIAGPRPTIERVIFTCGKCEWRIDLENLRGHNLRF